MAEDKSNAKENTQENTKETKAPKAKVGTNPLTLPWPQDPQGQLRDLKSGGTKAAARVNGNREKLDKYIETLRILKEHAVERFKRDVEARKEAQTNTLSARVRVEERRRKEAEAKAAEYEKAAQRVRREAGIVDLKESKE